MTNEQFMQSVHAEIWLSIGLARIRANPGVIEDIDQPEGAQTIDPESDLFCSLAKIRCSECNAFMEQFQGDDEPLCDACYDAQDPDETATNVALDNRMRAEDFR